MQSTNLLLESFKLGAISMGLIIAIIGYIKLMIDEFRKPRDEKAYQERMAYLKDKRRRWDDYFVERKLR